MTDIIRAKNSGFCFGVRQAIEKTEEQIEKNKDGRRIYTFGPLIHNRLVTDGLRAKGVNILDDLSQASLDDIIIVRSHGESREFWNKAKGDEPRRGRRYMPFCEQDTWTGFQSL